MDERLRFLLNRIAERLWVKPLAMCVLSVAGVLLARMADRTKLPDVDSGSDGVRQRCGASKSSRASMRASRAVNDPGTAIDVIGTFVRLFALWAEPVAKDEIKVGNCDRVEVTEVLLADMFDDAFPAIAREGAGAFEVAVQLQKALGSLAMVGSDEMRQLARRHASLALARSEQKLDFADDLKVLREVASRPLILDEQGL
jgi:uncharacterized membrane protein